MESKGMKCLDDYRVAKVSTSKDFVKGVKTQQVYYQGKMEKGGLTVTLKANATKKVYYSYSYPFPSAALSDGYFSDGKTVIPSKNSRVIYFSFKGLLPSEVESIKVEQWEKKTEPVNPADHLIELKKNAIKFATNAIQSKNLKNDNDLIADQVCGDLWRTYAKEEFECIVGTNLAVANRRDFLNRYEFRFELSKKQFAIVVYIPDN